MLKITSFYVQVVLILTRNSGISWPPFFAQLFFQASQAAGFSPTAIECVFHGIDVALIYVVNYLLPPLFALIGMFDVTVTGSL